MGEVLGGLKISLLNAHRVKIGLYKTWIQSKVLG